MNKPIDVKDTIELWQQFNKSIDSKSEVYDKRLLEEISKELGFKAGCDFELELKNHNVSKEQLLAVLIKSLQPFSLMMSDLLKMFEDADAQYTDCTLKMEFNFELAEKSLNLNLNSFRVYTEKVKKIAFYEMQLESCNIWKEIVNPLKVIVDEDYFIRSYDYMIPGDIRSWLDSYQKGKTIWPEFSVVPPRIGVDSIDSIISKLWGIPKLAIEKYRECFDPNLGRMKTLSAQLTESSNFYQAETDYWVGYYVELLCCFRYKIVDLLNSKEKEECNRAIQAFEQKMEEYLNSLPIQIVEHEDLVKEFLDFLLLPIWKVRSALYSAWVATQIIDSFKNWNVEYHVVDGALLFSFGGSEIAHLKKESYDLTLYAELNTLFNNPVSKKRKKHIQPDYSIFINDKDDPNNTVLVVECKQYKKASKRNFTEAIIDYANGRPNAKVVLVNYTKIPERFKESLPLDISKRTPFFNELSPGCDGCDKFNKAVLGSVLKKSSINLLWEKNPTDLDLILDITNPGGAVTRIDYRNKGDYSCFPYARLDDDITHEYGNEIIKADILPSYKYDVLVHNFSGEETEGEIVVKAIIDEVNELSLTRSTNLGRLEAWYVLSFEYLSTKEVNLDVPFKMEDE